MIEFITCEYILGKIDFFATQLIVFLETYHPTNFFILLVTNVRFGFIFSHQLRFGFDYQHYYNFFVTKLIAFLETNH